MTGFPAGSSGGARRRGRRSPLRAVVIWALLTALWPVAAGATVGVTPHRAVYSLDLGEARGDSSVIQARGRLEFEWGDVCDGWVVRQRTLLTVGHRRGGESQSNWSISSWESKDGLRYRFYVRKFRSDGRVEAVRGEASLTAPGGAGEAVFRGAEDRQMELPAGTVFPTYYSLELLALAESQALPVWHLLFDGFGLDDLQGVSAALVGPVAADESASLESSLIEGQPSWRIRLAYFPLERRSPEPEREQGFRVFANGIVDELVIDYGEFTIDAALEELAPLPDAGC